MTKSACAETAPDNSILFRPPGKKGPQKKKKKPSSEKKPLSRKICRSSPPPPKTSSPPPPLPPPFPCHRRPLACIFMKSLFRTTIHRDEQRTMTGASAAEMRRWRLREEGKKKGDRGRSGRGRLVSIREGEKGWCKREKGERWRKSARTPNTRHIQPLVPAVRSSVRFFVMTVDETMTYFSGFSLPGVPHGSAIHIFPRAASLPAPQFLRTRARCLGCIRGVSCAFLFARYSSSLSLNPSTPALSSRVIRVEKRVKACPRDCSRIICDSTFHFERQV